LTLPEYGGSTPVYGATITNPSSFFETGLGIPGCAWNVVFIPEMNLPLMKNAAFFIIIVGFLSQICGVADPHRHL
jgi:hypothetical protein